MSIREISIPHKAGIDPDAEALRLKVARSVVDLHVARRNLLIYPITHEQVKQSLARAYKGLIALIHAEDSVTLAVMKAGISYNDQLLVNGTPILKDLAGVLRKYQVAAVTFNTGLGIKELAGFIQLLCMDLEKIRAKGGIAAAVKERHFSAIQIRDVDYSKLQFTNEQVIQRSSDEKTKGDSIWQRFVTSIMSDPSDRDQKTGRSDFNPAGLADLMNQQQIDAELVVRHYQSTLDRVGHFESTETTLANELLAFQKLIRELDSDLKRQFLSVTFENCRPGITSEQIAHLIDGLGGDLIIQMIRLANSEGKEISPSLLAFIQKMGHSDVMADKPNSAGPIDSNQKTLSARNVESLLAREQYDTYVDTGYGSLLDILTHDTRSVGRDSNTRSLLEKVEGELTLVNIHIHTGQAIARLMIQSRKASDYRKWARQLTYLLDDLLDSQAYGYLTQLMHLLQREQQDPDNEHAEIAGLALDRFSDPQFVAKALAGLKSHTGEFDEEALAFFMDLGEPVVVEIFDGLDPQQTFNEQGILNRILQNLSKFTIAEALERLNDSDPNYVQRMIRIIRQIGNPDSAAQMRSMTDHEDVNVQLEALATLLEFKNKWGEVGLGELLSDPSGDAFIRAVGLAGRYRVISAVPLLENVAINRGDQYLREAAIRALGRIGDPRSITTLSKLARRRWGIAQKHNRQLRKVIFDSLEGYPRASAEGLLRYGLRLKDEQIRIVCHRLLWKGGQAATQTPS